MDSSWQHDKLSPTTSVLQDWNEGPIYCTAFKLSSTGPTVPASSHLITASAALPPSPLPLPLTGYCQVYPYWCLAPRPSVRDTAFRRLQTPSESDR